MGSPEPYIRSKIDYNLPKRPSKVVKTKPRPRKPRKPSKLGLKLKNGLLNTVILARSEAMRIAESNSLESPLLQLPGEIKNKIWKYALGHHQIDIRNKSRGSKLSDVELGYDARPEGFQSGPTIQRAFVKPTFALPGVCRQTYVETATLVYTLNTFTFTDYHTLDRFIKDRVIGQRRLITSIDVPLEYFRLYSDEFRKPFRQTFPNLKRVGVHAQVALSMQRVIPWTWNLIRPIKEPLEDTKMRLESWVQEKEGADLEVDWYEGMETSFIYSHY